MNDKVWIVGYRDYGGFNIKDVYDNEIEAKKHVKLLNVHRNHLASLGMKIYI